MGNNQSSHRSRPHNRLAKPKTSSNKTPSQHSSLTSRFAQLSVNDRQQIKSQLLSPLETEFENASVNHETKLHVIDDASSPASAGIQRGFSNSSRTNSMSCFGSRRESSSKLNSVSGSKVSLHDAMDVETAVRILEEVKRNASPEDMAALQLALQPSPPSPLPRSSSAIDPVASLRNSAVLNRSTSSLIRRRSLVSTPGLATRNSPAEKNRRTWNSWRTPHVDPEEEAKWHTDKAPTRLSKELAPLDLTKEERSSSPTQRAVTPSDREYSHLGSLQLGSLRIANGEPSPAPARALEHLSREDDYFSPQDVEDAPITMKATKRRGHTRSISALLPPTPPLYKRLSTSIRKSKTLSRCDSPQKTDNQTKPEPPLRAETLPARIQDDGEPEPVRRLRVMNKSADTLATMATHLQTEEASYDIDEGFVSDEDRAPPAAQIESYRILNGAMFGEPLTTIDSLPFENVSNSPRAMQLPAENLARYDNAVIPTVETPEPEVSATRPPPTKADSGYSSAGSFVLVQRHAMREESPPLAEESLVEHTLEATTPKAAAREHARPAMLQIPGNINSSIPGHVYGVDSPRTPVSSLSKNSVEIKGSPSTRLQKRRPSQQELPAVSPMALAPQSTIPDVPSDMREKFATRMTETPGTDRLPQFSPSEDHISQSEGKEERTEQRNRSRSMTERPETPSRLRRSLSLFRSKSRSGKEKDTALEQEANDASLFLDLGDIGAALGRSPYDAAIDAAFRHTVATPTYPHQMGNVMPQPRTKSAVSMDAKTASDLARARSRDRSQVHRPQMPQRPKSFHQSSYDGSSTSPQLPRRRSFHVDSDIPPVPTLHSSIPPVPTLHPSMRSAYNPNHRPSSSHSPAVQTERPDPSVRARSTEPSVRVRPTGRGPVVSKIVNQYDQYGDWIPVPEEWHVKSPSPLQQQRRRNNTVGAHPSGYAEYHRERQRSRSASAQPLPQQQHHYPPQRPQTQQSQMQMQHPQQRPQPQRRAVSMYGRHSLPSQDPGSAYHGGEAAAVSGAQCASPTTTTKATCRAANTAVGTRQLHSYNNSKFAARYYSTTY